MATPLRAIKYWWLIVAFLSGLALAMLAEDLILDSHDNRLEFSAPRVHFLSGKPLERLRNAAEVPFDFKITLWAGDHTHVARSAVDQFVVSYDLWQENFSVIKTQSPRRTGSHFTAAAAEAWCMEQMTMDVTGLSGSEPLWARLEIRAEDPVTRWRPALRSRQHHRKRHQLEQSDSNSQPSAAFATSALFGDRDPSHSMPCEAAEGDRSISDHKISDNGCAGLYPAKGVYSA